MRSPPVFQTGIPFPQFPHYPDSVCKVYDNLKIFMCKAIKFYGKKKLPGAYSCREVFFKILWIGAAIYLANTSFTLSFGTISS